MVVSGRSRRGCPLWAGSTAQPMQSPPKVGVCIASGATCLCCHLRSMKCFCRTVFGADSENQIKRITAIPKLTMFGTAVFLCIFFIPFFLQIDFRRVCAEQFLVSEMFLQRKNNHFSVIFESMPRGEKRGIIKNVERYEGHTKTAQKEWRQKWENWRMERRS